MTRQLLLYYYTPSSLPNYPRNNGTSFSLTSSAMMATAMTDMTTSVARPPGREAGATDTAPGVYRCCHAIAAGMIPKRERMPKAPG